MSFNSIFLSKIANTSSGDDNRTYRSFQNKLLVNLNEQKCEIVNLAKSDYIKEKVFVYNDVDGTANVFWGAFRESKNSKIDVLGQMVIQKANFLKSFSKFIDGISEKSTHDLLSSVYKIIHDALECTIEVLGSFIIQIESDGEISFLSNKCFDSAKQYYSKIKTTASKNGEAVVPIMPQVGFLYKGRYSVSFKLSSNDNKYCENRTGSTLSINSEHASKIKNGFSEIHNNKNVRIERIAEPFSSKKESTIYTFFFADENSGKGVPSILDDLISNFIWNNNENDWMINFVNGFSAYERNKRREMVGVFGECFFVKTPQLTFNSSNATYQLEVTDHFDFNFDDLITSVVSFYKRLKLKTEYSIVGMTKRIQKDIFAKKGIFYPKLEKHILELILFGMKIPSSLETKLTKVISQYNFGSKNKKVVSNDVIDFCMAILSVNYELKRVNDMENSKKEILIEYGKLMASYWHIKEVAKYECSESFEQQIKALFREKSKRLLSLQKNIEFFANKNRAFSHKAKIVFYEALKNLSAKLIECGDIEMPEQDKNESVFVFINSYLNTKDGFYKKREALKEEQKDILS